MYFVNTIDNKVFSFQVFNDETMFQSSRVRYPETLILDKIPPHAKAGIMPSNQSP